MFSLFSKNYMSILMNFYLINIFSFFFFVRLVGSFKAKTCVTSISKRKLSCCEQLFMSTASAKVVLKTFCSFLLVLTVNLLRSHLGPPPPRWGRTGTRSSGPEGSATFSSSLLFWFGGFSSPADQRLIVWGR